MCGGLSRQRSWSVRSRGMKITKRTAANVGLHRQPTGGMWRWCGSISMDLGSHASIIWKFCAHILTTLESRLTARKIKQKSEKNCRDAHGFVRCATAHAEHVAVRPETPKRSASGHGRYISRLTPKAPRPASPRSPRAARHARNLCSRHDPRARASSQLTPRGGNGSRDTRAGEVRPRRCKLTRRARPPFSLALIVALRTRFPRRVCIGRRQHAH